MKTAIPTGQSGPWSISRIDIEEVGDVMPGCGLDDASPGTYTALIHETRGIVSCDSPVLFDDQMPVVSKAQGHVMLGGLGVGLAVELLLECKKVTHITVVEQDMDVIALVAPSFDNERITYVCHDVLDMPEVALEPAPDRVWLDIWDTDRPETLEDRLLAIADWGPRCAWVKAAALPRVFMKAHQVMRGS